MSENVAADREVATLGGGCFWCTEAVFEQLRGVDSVVSGYAGGTVERPTYEQICTGRTGHAEVVHLTFDPNVISYDQLLNVFFATHDPTSPNRQGADAGTQYRSVIFVHSAQQQEAAKKKIAELDAELIWPAPIVTQVVPAPTFYPGEDYHQGYFRANGENQPYCRAVVSPKVAKFRSKFVDLLKS